MLNQGLQKWESDNLLMNSNCTGTWSEEQEQEQDWPCYNKHQWLTTFSLIYYKFYIVVPESVAQT